MLHDINLKIVIIQAANKNTIFVYVDANDIILIEKIIITHLTKQ